MTQQNCGTQALDRNMAIIGWNVLATTLTFTGLSVAAGAVTGRLVARWTMRKQAAPEPPAVDDQRLLRFEQEAADARDAAAGARRLANDVLTNAAAHSTRVDQIGRKLSTALAQNDLDVQLAAAQEALGRMAAVNADLNLKLRDAEQRLKQIHGTESSDKDSGRDSLTGLPSEAAFGERLERAAEDVRLLGTTSCLAMLDVDGMQKLNDRLSQEGGDQVFRQIADLARRTVRETDEIVRAEGSGFGLFLPDTTLAEATVAVERLRRAVANRVFRYRGQAVDVTVSLGLAEKLPLENHVEWQARAAQSLRSAKGDGRNCCYRHDGERPVRIDGPSVDIQPGAAGGKDRRKFNRSLRISSLPDDGKISSATFCLIPCREISATGFAFLSPRPVSSLELLVEIGEAPTAVYLTAVVIGCQQVHAEETPGYRVDCRFVARVAVH